MKVISISNTYQHQLVPCFKALTAIYATPRNKIIIKASRRQTINSPAVLSHHLSITHKSAVWVNEGQIKLKKSSSYQKGHAACYLIRL